MTLEPVQYSTVRNAVVRVPKLAALAVAGEMGMALARVDGDAQGLGTRTGGNPMGLVAEGQLPRVTAPRGAEAVKTAQRQCRVSATAAAVSHT
jgi:hypothetical protein